jgi:AbrB family looped-hinge helix DNA binding protein
MTVKVSPKFQVVIPKEIRKSMRIKAGQKMAWLQIGRRLQLVPVIPARKLYGFAKGMSTDNIRDEED